MKIHERDRALKHVTRRFFRFTAISQYCIFLPIDNVCENNYNKRMIAICHRNLIKIMYNALFK